MEEEFTLSEDQTSDDVFVPDNNVFTLSEDQTSDGAFIPEDDQQFLEGSLIRELGEGIASGVIGIGEGVIGLGGTLLDLGGETNYADRVYQAGQDLRDAAGIDPEGIVGKGAEVITQFVVPGVGVASKVGKGARLARSKLIGPKQPLTKKQKFNQAGKELAALTGTEFVVSGDDTTTIGDWVEMGPTETTDLIGLEGSERALARLANRARVSIEGSGIGLAAQGVLSTAGKTIGDAQITKDIAAATKRKIDAVGQSIDDLIDQRTFERASETGNELSRFKKVLADGLAFSRYRGALPTEVAEKRLALDGAVRPAIQKAERILNDFDTAIDDLLPKLPTDDGVISKADILNDTLDYLTKKDRKDKATYLKRIPKAVRPNALRMRKHIDSLTNDVLDTDFLKRNNFTTSTGQSIDDVIRDNLGSYLRRKYKVFEEKNFTPTAEGIKAGDDYFTKNKKATAKQLTDAAKKDLENTTFNKVFLEANGLTKTGSGDTLEIIVNGKVTPAAAARARDEFLSKYTIRNRGKMSTGRAARDRLDTGMFMSTKSFDDGLKKLMGEIDDPRGAYLNTIADLAQFTAVDDYFATVAKLADSNSGIGRFFRKATSEQQEKVLSQQGYVKLGGGANDAVKGKPTTVQSASKQAEEMEAVIENSGWGSLNGYFVPEAVYKNLTQTVIGNDSFGTSLLRGTWNTALKAKGLSQYSKTVLSPITQVRNFTTALAFATANGNVPVFGRGGNLKDATKAVLSNVRNKGDEALFDDLADAQRRGVLGTNAELREIQDSLNKGIGKISDQPENFVEALSGKAGQTKLAKGVGKIAKGFESAYQGSDDFWKYFNYNAEQAKLRNALGTVDLEKQVLYLTKNLSDVDVDTLSKLQPFRRGETTIEELVSRGVIDMDDLVKNRAAQIVRDTVPNYNKGASELVQLGRKLPFGNFITFPAEMYRTGFNIVRQGLDDMASDIPAIQSRGRGRLTGFISTTAIVPIAALELAYATTGVSREEMDAMKRSFGAPWQKGSVLVPVGKTEDGKIEYVNFSTSNPYDVLSRFANRALSEADDAMAEGRDPGAAMVDIVAGTLGEAFAPFLDEAILTNAVVDIFYRGGKTETGARVFNPQEAWSTKAFKSAAHIADTMIPTILKAADVTTGEPSRFVRGVLGDGLGIDAISPQDNMGRERTWQKELARLSTGFSSQEFDPKKGLRFAGYRLSQGQTDAKRIFNTMTDDFNVTPQSLFDGFAKANEAKLRNDRQYFRMIEDLRVLGMKDSDIRRELKRNNIGGVKGILRGVFEPFKLSSQNKKELRRTGTFNQLPIQSINELRNQLRNLPLDPTVDRPVANEPVPIEVPEPVVEVAPVQDFVPVQPLLNSSSVSASAPKPEGSLLQRARSMGSSLLGGDLGSQSANAEIAARQDQ